MSRRNRSVAAFGAAAWPSACGNAPGSVMPGGSRSPGASAPRSGRRRWRSCSSSRSARSAWGRRPSRALRPVRAGANGPAPSPTPSTVDPSLGPSRRRRADAVATMTGPADRHAGSDRDPRPDGRPRRQLRTGRRGRHRRVRRKRRIRPRRQRQRQRQERRRRRRGEHAPPDVNPVLDRRPRRRELGSGRRGRRRLEPQRLGQRRLDRVVFG